MGARSDLSRLAVSGLFVFVAACSEPPTAPGLPTIPRPPTTPGPPTAPSEPQPPTSVMTTFAVTNGWTGEVVPDALISANGTQAVTDRSGQVQFLKTGNCLKVELAVSGFLERRTCSTSAITLWPVADEEEREATRTMAFRLDQTLANVFSTLPLTIEVGLAQDLQYRPDVVRAWTSAADDIKRLTLNRISISFGDPVPPDYPDGALIIAPVAATSDCDARFSPWPVATAGFCGQYSPEHWYILRYNVLLDRLTDSSVALRALLTGALGMRPHAMPGLLNRNQPDREVSAFERKTLHMIGLRYGVVRWPDLEP